MRVFLPSTLPALTRALRTGQVSSGPVPGYAVTPALRESYASGDAEELEYVALTQAARASLRLLTSDPAAPPRRVVLAADIPADQVTPDARDREPARVLISAAISAERLASVHVDDEEASADVRAAAGALPAADAGDEDARFTVDGAESHELGWYATQELPFLAELRPGRGKIFSSERTWYPPRRRREQPPRAAAAERGPGRPGRPLCGGRVRGSLGGQAHRLAAERS